MTDDDDDWAPPPVHHGGGYPVVAAADAYDEAAQALVSGFWIPDMDEIDAAVTILHRMDVGQRSPDIPLRRTVHRALSETYPLLTIWRGRPLYLYAAVKTVQLLASAPPHEQQYAAEARHAWDRLGALLRAVTSTVGTGT
ncbi:hypothetical protein MXD61_27240 [Frankia sp. AgPm24]|uniref:Uncharacterized protein n=1 Tax=Frankia umida TaxID=573489 RepID=A0ABT0JZZ0_9ACTN|nr:MULTISPECIES: hypothetical protein [Frankia]MCK9877100.1 hypothetical protein [Frankia umida]MCK9925525.1 hypothetical protein [Frankia sp. AgPm24]